MLNRSILTLNYQIRKLKKDKAKNKTKKFNDENEEEKPVPLYRLPQGLKRIELEKLKMPGMVVVILSV